MNNDGDCYSVNDSTNPAGEQEEYEGSAVAHLGGIAQEIITGMPHKEKLRIIREASLSNNINMHELMKAEAQTREENNYRYG